MTNPVSQIKEWCDKQGLREPEYEFEPRNGGWWCEVRVNGTNLPTFSDLQHNKKAAKMGASTKLANHMFPPSGRRSTSTILNVEERHVVSVLTFQWQDIEDIVNHVHEKYFPDQPPSATLHAKVERVIEELHGEGEVEERLTPSGSLYYRLPSSKSIFSSPTQSLGSPSSSLLQLVPYRELCLLAREMEENPFPFGVPEHSWSEEGPDKMVDVRSGDTLDLCELLMKDRKWLLNMVSASYRLQYPHIKRMVPDANACRVFKHPEHFIPVLDACPPPKRIEQQYMIVGSAVKAWPIPVPVEKEARQALNICTRLVLSNVRWIVPHPTEEQNVSAHALYITDCSFGQEDPDVQRAADASTGGRAFRKGRPFSQEVKARLLTCTREKVRAEQGRWYPVKFLGWVISSETRSPTLVSPNWILGDAAVSEEGSVSSAAGPSSRRPVELRTFKAGND